MCDLDIEAVGVGPHAPDSEPTSAARSESDAVARHHRKALRVSKKLPGTGKARHNQQRKERQGRERRVHGRRRRPRP